MARSKRAAWAAPTFSALPYHAFSTLYCRARPYEKVRAHGLATFSRAFMAFKLREASSSLWPPERKVTPGRAGTIVRERVLTVYHAISAGFFLSGQEAPGVTMLGFKSVPSMIKLWSSIAFITAAKTRSDTSAQTSIVWSPSCRISGSMIGTRPLSWQMEP